MLEPPGPQGDLAEAEREGRRIKEVVSYASPSRRGFVEHEIALYGSIVPSSQHADGSGRGWVGWPEETVTPTPTTYILSSRDTTPSIDPETL